MIESIVDPIVMLVAYLDESERKSGTFCVAGFAFAPEQCRKFIKEWSRLFGGITFHMKDIAAGRGEFSTTSQQERDRLLRDAVKLIKKRISFGVAISCDVNEMHRLSPRFIRGFGDAYPVCCHITMGALGQKITDSGLDERVKYVSEAGHRFQAEANDFISNAVETPVASDFYRYHDHSFLPKSDAVPLQAADFMAWEWAKFRDETLDRRVRPIRPSLVALMDDRLGQYCGNHLAGPALAKFMKEIRQLGLLQLQDDREARKKRKRQ